MKIKIYKKFVSRGFTLIELLVVISIIGLLSSVVLASLSTARVKAQDAARISNVKSLKTALELYYSTNNTYPQLGDVALNNGTLISALVPTYIGSIPVNLITDGDRYYSDSGSGPNEYGLKIYTSSGVWCRTGVSGNMATNGWWGSILVCNF